jgi:D-tyrosyl-tRNA(Tyr) deacylase
MIAVVLRVTSAAVSVEGELKSSIGSGLLILVSIENADSKEDTDWLAGKIASMRIFNDDSGIMNLSAKDVGGELLVISQFTLHASTRKGNRPSYIKAARPEIAVPLYERFIQALEVASGREVARGVFGADMKVSLLNDGPVTIVIDTKNKV